MTNKDNSLLVGTTLSLTDDQIDTSFKRFKEAIKDLASKPQVELKDDENRPFVRLEFISISKSYVVNSPSISIEMSERCKNMETVKTITAHAQNCGMCRGGSSITFNAKNYGNFEQILRNMVKLFTENYDESIKIDREQVDFAKEVHFVQMQFQSHTEENPKKKYSDNYLGTIVGEIHEDQHDKTYKIVLEDLSYDQIMKLVTTVPNL